MELPRHIIRVLAHWILKSTLNSCSDHLFSIFMASFCLAQQWVEFWSKTGTSIRLGSTDWSHQATYTTTNNNNKNLVTSPPYGLVSRSICLLRYSFQCLVLIGLSGPGLVITLLYCSTWILIQLLSHIPYLATNLDAEDGSLYLNSVSIPLLILSQQRIRVIY